MSVVSDIELQSALEAVASAAGLDLGGPLDVGALTALAGPFITREVTGADGAPLLCVAVRDSTNPGVEDLCLALVQATAGGADGVEGVPVAGGADLVARLAGLPFEATALLDRGEVQALVLLTTDRRGGSLSVGAERPGGLAAGSEAAATVGRLDKLNNVALDVSVELGRTRVTLSEVLEFDVGSVVELDRAAGAPVDIRVNGTLLAQGEVVLIDDEYAVRITAIVEPGTQ
jgi:flagellar motor switch protein FliN